MTIKARFVFPRGFLWGTATSSHQVEGQNTNNNWWAWEQEGHIAQGHSAALACNWWGGRWREDFDRAAEAGQNAHRLSVEWSRIQPAPDRWDEEALDHYRQMVRGLVERNLTPVVTLHHFTDPLWLSEQGGWERPEVVAAFARYVEKVVEALKEYVPLWCTINEPNVYAVLGYVTGEFPPGRQDDVPKALQVMEHMARAHAAAYEVIHRVHPEARVGLVHHLRPMQAARPSFPPDGVLARWQDRLFNAFFLRALGEGVLLTPWGRRKAPELRGKQDFLGVNYYTAEQVAFTWAPQALFSRRFYRPEAPLSEHGDIAHEPLAFAHTLRRVARYGLPIIVTENGVEDSHDTLRPRYLAEHVHQMWRVINNNVPIKGYFHWTLVDNFEWHHGWTRRFGLWALDPETQVRTKRPSADLYAALCRENALDAEMVDTFAPAARPAIFPE